MDDSLRNKILEDINKTGYLLELIVARKLYAKNWRTFVNRSYVDPETKKIRETDVYAFNAYQIDNIYLEVNLVIETKKHSKPWVIFVNHYDAEIVKDIRSFETHLFLDNFNLDLIDTYQFSDTLPRMQVDYIGRNFYEAFKSPNENSKIYEAIISVGKAAIYHRDKEKYDGAILDSDNYDKTKPTKISVFLPLIILEGVLSIATITESLEINFQETNYCPVDLDFDDDDFNDSTYLVDIITKDYLEEYIVKIETWINSVVTHIKNNH